jgi:hypothetical protein
MSSTTVSDEVEGSIAMNEVTLARLSGHVGDIG